MNQIIVKKPIEIKKTNIQYNIFSRTNAANYITSTTTLPDCSIELAKNRFVVYDNDITKNNDIIITEK